MSGYHFKSYSESTTNGFNGMSHLHQPIVNNNNSTTIQVHHDSGGQPSSGSIIRIHSDSQQSLERLFNPHINETSVVPLRQRNLPSSFFNPTPSNGNSTTRLDGVPEQRVVNSANLHIRSTSSHPRPKANGLHMRSQSVLAPMTGLSVPSSLAVSSGSGSVNQMLRSNDTLSNSSTNCSMGHQATASGSSGFGGSNLTTTSSSSSNLLGVPSMQPMSSIVDPQHQTQPQFSSHQNQSNRMINQHDHQTQLSGNVVVASGGFHNRNYSSPVVLTNNNNPLHHNHHLLNHHHHNHNHLQQAHHNHINHSHHQQQQAYSGQTAGPMNTQDFGQAAPASSVQYPTQGHDPQATSGCGFGAQTAALSTSNTQLATAPSQMLPHVPQVASDVQCVSSTNQMHNHSMHQHHHHHRQHHHQLQPTEALNQQMANTSLNAPPTFQLLSDTNDPLQQQLSIGGHNLESQQQLVHNQQPATSVVAGNTHCRFYSTPVAMNNNPFNQQSPAQHQNQQQQYSDYYGQR